MSLQVRRDADHPRVPWRNGGGVTAEVASSPEGATAGADFDWRISLADITGSGPFSPFPGVQRVITLLDGPAMTLHTPDGAHTLAPFEPFAFDGDWAVHCEVPAPTRDLNVMTRRGRCTATVTVAEVSAATGPLDLTPATPLVVVTLTGAVDAVDDGATAPLHPGDALSTDGSLRLQGDGRVAVVRLASQTAGGAAALTRGAVLDGLDA